MRPLGRDDVEPNRLDNEGLTPLAGIVRCGHVEPTKTQLGYPDVDLNLRDRDGLDARYPLVPEAGCEGVLRMLLNGANIDPGPVKGDRLIPLSRAAACW